ncbi:hypothetical protein QRO11_07030 [Paracidovorax citrulli]|uniref:Uncharacterized protein n=1 Tax=Paracidovorax citrulli TaxID=80869 RepID=A0ABY9ATT8_PARCI|nr:hypothetical protein [Paracidovorax citrulli]MVT37014.1 hypothetical protein [Paracidovorax citrulli]PVY63447.1 hypothetical protein C8E08_0733 [Paracidovorax citrulli]QCX09447.1 hypothetical protein APS58_0493 [Paracidovorax citrulli]REG67586.1 hypothetical protein C8E07_0656 [Paracidovorax citrulli]RLJ92146.1 hypothetical protein C8E06_0657 [Paracidovorax citrulli]
MDEMMKVAMPSGDSLGEAGNQGNEGIAPGALPCCHRPVTRPGSNAMKSIT